MKTSKPGELYKKHMKMKAKKTMKKTAKKAMPKGKMHMKAHGKHTKAHKMTASC